MEIFSHKTSSMRSPYDYKATRPRLSGPLTADLKNLPPPLSLLSSSMWILNESIAMDPFLIHTGRVSTWICERSIGQEFLTCGGDLFPGGETRVHRI
jgi:hypothetical protein